MIKRLYLINLLIVLGLFNIRPLGSQLPSKTEQQESIRFAVIGDYGLEGTPLMMVAMLVRNFNPDFVITTGDNSYGDTDIDDNIGQYFSEYIGSYEGQYGEGSEVNRFFPSLGNHDYSDGGGLETYLDYFTLPGEGLEESGTSGNERYYDFVQGSVHFFVLNSNSKEPDGTTSDSQQAEWLREQLAASTAPWKIVYMHHPPYSSGEKHEDSEELRWPFEDWGATAVLSGHEHSYERLVRDDNADGVLMPYFVIGLSGASLTLFDEEARWAEGSQFRYADSHGAMLVEATPSTLVFEFWSITEGGTWVDSYTLRKSETCVTAYNDLGWTADQPNHNITTYTASNGGSELPSEGFLVDYETGEPLAIALSVIGGDFTDAGAEAGSAALRGDALTVFGERISPLGTISYLKADDEVFILEFSGLDPGKRYNVVFYTNRAGGNSYEWERASSVSIFGAESFVNASSIGVDNNQQPVFFGPTDPSTRYAANNPDGRIVRYDHIASGNDGTFALVIRWDGIPQFNNEGRQEFRGRYANALMLQECQAAR